MTCHGHWRAVLLSCIAIGIGIGAAGYKLLRTLCCLGKVNRPTMFFYLAVAVPVVGAKSSFIKSLSIFVKPYKNAINRSINTSFVSVCILICISLKLPDNNHVKL